MPGAPRKLTLNPKLAAKRAQTRESVARCRARKRANAEGKPVPAHAMRMDPTWWREYILEHRNCKPLEVLAEAILRPLDEFAAELQCTKLEAYDRRMQAVAHLLPYMHSKMPLAVQLDRAPGVHLMLAGPEVVAAMAAAVDGAAATELKVINGQATEVSEDEGTTTNLENS